MPPVTRTVPSGSTVALCCRRAKFMGAVRFHCGLGSFQIDDLCEVCRQMCVKIQPATDIDNLSALVHHGRRVIAESCVAYWTRSPESPDR